MKSFFAGVLATNISEHYATFCFVRKWIGRISNVSKYSFRNKSEETLQALRNDLSNQLNFFDVLN